VNDLASLQNIINFLNRKYPNHGESNANIVNDLQDIHLDIYLKMQRLSNTFEIEEIDSVANQLEYELPDEIKVENIIQLLVSTNTEGTEFDKYEYRGIADVNVYGRYFGRASEGKIFIRENGQALRFDDLTIKIYYYRVPEELTDDDLDQVPELDTRYHDLLKYKIIHEIASQGHNPNTDIANFWLGKYNEKMKTVMSDLENNLHHSYNKIPEQKERW
jgi:hypothetical protein